MESFPGSTPHTSAPQSSTRQWPLNTFCSAGPVCVCVCVCVCSCGMMSSWCHQFWPIVSLIDHAMKGFSCLIIVLWSTYLRGSPLDRYFAAMRDIVVIIFQISRQSKICDLWRTSMIITLYIAYRTVELLNRALWTSHLHPHRGGGGRGGLSPPTFTTLGGWAPTP